MSRDLTEVKESAKCRSTGRAFHVRGKSKCEGLEMGTYEEANVAGVKEMGKSYGK